MILETPCPDILHLPMHARPRPATRPSSVVSSILLGMPHLSTSGLSENWLLKELGHLHWRMLARSTGQPQARFRDESGAPVYAAFCAISIAGVDFAAAGENDTLAISSTLARLSRTQMSSMHRLECAGRDIGSVTLISTFVRRSTSGGNHTVTRVRLDGLPPIDPEDPARTLFEIAARLRAGDVTRHMDFDLGPGGPLGSWTFDPCPRLDFNGAGFLYFPSFVAMVDRAEWQFDRERSGDAAPVSREVFYYGNVDRGETVTLRLLACRHTNRSSAHHCRLYRDSDGTLVADVFTRWG